MKKDRSTLDEIISWHDEWKALQDKLVRVDDVRSPENKELMIRSKELYSLLSKVRYFR